MKRLILAAMVALAMVAAPTAAQAAIVIDFQGGSGGTITSLPNGQWSGSIPLTIMTAYNTPLAPGGVPCNPPVTGCSLPCLSQHLLGPPPQPGG